MNTKFGLIQRPWGVYYLKNNSTGEQTSLKTHDRSKAERLLQAHNESESQPHLNVALARVYMNGADPKLITRTWQEVMEHIVETEEPMKPAGAGRSPSRTTTSTASATCPWPRRGRSTSTAPLADGKVSTNVYLRRIHNHALGMDWLLKPVIPRLQWPKPVFKQKRAITSAEHAAIIAREQNPERRDFYELLWHTGALADRRGLPDGEGHQLEHPHDLLLPEEAEVPDGHQACPDPLRRGGCGHPQAPSPVRSALPLPAHGPSEATGPRSSSSDARG